MIHIFARLYILASLFAILSCSQSDQNTIKFWAMGSEGENVKSIVQIFEAENPDIKVMVQAIPWGAAHEKLLTAFAGDASPDVCQLGNTWLAEFHAIKALAVLDSFVQYSLIINQQNYFPGIWNTNIHSGSLIGIPWYVDTRVLFYRKDILNQAGYDDPPQTWDEWLTIVRTIKGNFADEEKFPIFFSLIANDGSVPVMLIMANKGQFFKDADSKANFDHPKTREALQFYLTFFNENLASKSMTRFSNIYQGFEKGDFAMMINGPWVANELMKRNPDFVEKWSCSIMPKKETSASLAGGSSLVIFDQSNKKEQAWRLIEFLSRKDIQATFYEATHDLPANISVWDSLQLDNDPILSAFFEQLKHTQATPSIPEWEQIFVKIQESLETVIHKKQTLDQAIEKLNSEVDIILEKRRWLLQKGLLQSKN